MAQTISGEARSHYKIEISPDGTNWTDISGQANSVTPSGGDQQTGETFTADGDSPIVTNSNKTAAQTLEINIVYTEQSSEGFQIVRNAFESSDKRIYARYSPRGGQSGEKRYVCANAANTAIPVPIVNCLLPTGESGSGESLMGTIRLMTPKLKAETVS